MLLKLKRRIRNWLNDIPEEDGPMVNISKASMVSSIEKSNDLNGNPIRLSIHAANGGFIVETRTYDQRKDSHNSNLYIVTDQDQLGEEISKIITMVSLGR
jgi:hypothetical protein